MLVRGIEQPSFTAFLRCVVPASLAFARLSDSPLGAFAGYIVEKMTGSPAFATPLVSLTSIAAAQTVLVNAIAAARQGASN